MSQTTPESLPENTLLPEGGNWRVENYAALIQGHKTVQAADPQPDSYLSTEAIRQREQLAAERYAGLPLAAPVSFEEFQRNLRDSIQLITESLQVAVRKAVQQAGEDVQRIQESSQDIRLVEDTTEPPDEENLGMDGMDGEDFYPEEDDGPSYQDPTEILKDLMEEIFEDALELFDRKNREYGNAISRTGALGSAVALVGDANRMRKLCIEKRPDEWDRENVEDKFMDILVQAAIGLLMMRNNNLVGED